MIARVDQLTSPPVPGRFYLVPTVRGRWRDQVRDWPVIGPEHEDAEIIGFPPMHYHVDARFVSARVSCSWPARTTTIDDTTGTPIIFGDKSYSPNPAPVVWRRRKCRREQPVYPVEYVRSYAWLRRLEAAYAGCRLKPGMICPHRGAPLTGLPMIDGIVTCPLHGLQWRVDTGELYTGEPS